MRKLGIAAALFVGACAAPHRGESLARVESPAPDEREAARAELRALHDATLEQHRRGDWQGLVGAMRDPSINVGRGTIAQVSRDDAGARFRRYLERADFSRYGDLSEPIVVVSDDATLGWVIARVRVEGTYRAENGASASLDATWSWIELYERTDGGWLRVGTVSSYDAARSPVGFAGALGSPDASVVEILDAAERAFGGRAVIDGIDRIYTEATVQTPRGAATTRVAAAADGRIVFDQSTSHGDRVVIRALRDGQWKSVNDEVGEATIEARLVAEGHALHAMLLSPTRFLRKPRRSGDSEFDGARCHVLEFDDALGKPARVYYDADTGLPRGIDFIEPGSEPAERIRVAVGDWRWLGPVRVFFQASFTHRGLAFDYDYREIRFHDVPDRAFAVPPTKGTARPRSEALRRKAEHEANP